MYPDHDIQRVCRDQCPEFQRPKIIVQSLGLFQRSFGTRSSFNGASKPRMLNKIQAKNSSEVTPETLVPGVWRGYQGRD